MTIAVVLHHTQDLVNIAQVVRAMKNFELDDLRLVQPAEYDPRRIEGIAHNTGDLIRRIRLFERLDDAVADCTLVAGLTARGRESKRTYRRPREAAGELLAAAADAPVALLLGPEDRGLTNEELDRCHRTVTIPTNPAHSSMNLAQAFTITAYELYVAGGGAPLKRPKRKASAATRHDLELLFADVERALGAIEFFKAREPVRVMRTVRETVHRASLDQREAKLGRAIAIEVVRFLERKGVHP